MTPDRIYISLYIYITVFACLFMLFVQVVFEATASCEPLIGQLNVDVREVEVSKATIHGLFLGGNLAGLGSSLPTRMATLQHCLPFRVIAT